MLAALYTSVLGYMRSSSGGGGHITGENDLNSSYGLQRIMMMLYAFHLFILLVF